MSWRRWRIFFSLSEVAIFIWPPRAAFKHHHWPGIARVFWTLRVLILTVAFLFVWWAIWDSDIAYHQP